MPSKNLVLFMGTEACGMYPFVSQLRTLGVKCGAPLPRLHTPLATRFSPQHANLWYWEAIRRIFDELGLPPIAEIPVSRLSCEARECYVRMLARCLGRHLGEGSYVCADHLTAFMLPFVLDALKYMNATASLYLFVNNPAHEIAERKYTAGQPASLTEFIWRNTVLSAIRYGKEKIQIIDSESFSVDNIARLFDDVSLPLDSRIAEKISSLSADTIKIDTSNISLSLYTRNLYETLCLYQRGEIEWKALLSVADDIYSTGEQFNGWQFVDCLECNIINGYAEHLAANSYSPLENEGEDKLVAEKEEEWMLLLENAERKLMKARQDFDENLFINADLSHKYYSRLLEDERQMYEQKLIRIQHEMMKQHKMYVHKICLLIKKLFFSKERP